jgi:hypothetical protein
MYEKIRIWNSDNVLIGNCCHLAGCSQYGGSSGKLVRTHI